MPDLTVFISYRRSDAGGHAGRLYDALRRRLGTRAVFMDVGSLRPGDEWQKVIEREIARCDVMLVLIGPDWATTADATGQPRLAADADPVRIEIEAGLAADRELIPVLLGGAHMPASAGLPESIRALAGRHAIEISNSTYAAGVRTLVAALRDLSPTAASLPAGQRGGASVTLTFLFTDIAGSTELLARIGEDGARLLFERHHTLLTKALADNGGTELEWLGDGIVASFGSSADAVKAALAMQRGARRPIGGETLAVRIGLHTGEAMRREGGYFGNAVVIARRLCDRARPGQVLTSGFVASMLGGRQFEFQPLGALELKGIAQPVEAFEVLAAGTGPTTPVAAAVATVTADAVPAAPKLSADRRPMALVVGAAVGVVVIVGGLLVALGLLDSGKPTGNAPVIAGGTNIVEFPSCPTRSCFIHLLDAVDDPDGDPLTIVSVGPSDAGATVSVGSDGGIASAIWRPPADFTGSTDSFAFTVSDNHHNLVQGTCHVVDIPPP